MYVSTLDLIKWQLVVSSDDHLIVPYIYVATDMKACHEGMACSGTQIL